MGIGAGSAAGTGRIGRRVRVGRWRRGVHRCAKLLRKRLESLGDVAQGGAPPRETATVPARPVLARGGAQCLEEFVREVMQGPRLY